MSIQDHTSELTLAYASSVLENALQRLSYDSREAAFMRCDEILAEFSTWPFGIGTSNSSGPVNIGGGSKRRDGGSGIGRESVQELVREVRKEMASDARGAGSGGDEPEDLCFEVVATVLEIFSRMDSLVSLIVSQLVVPHGSSLLRGASWSDGRPILSVVPDYSHEPTAKSHVSSVANIVSAVIVFMSRHANRRARQCRRCLARDSRVIDFSLLFM